MLVDQQLNENMAIQYHIVHIIIATSMMWTIPISQLDPISIGSRIEHDMIGRITG
jgi:hypothetical protein